MLPVTMKETSKKNHTHKTIMLTDPDIFVEVASMKIRTILIRGIKALMIMKLIRVHLVLLTYVL
jgi:hypothetical protein